MRRYDHALKSELIEEAGREINQTPEDEAIDELIEKVSDGLYAIAPGEISSSTIIFDLLKRRFRPISDGYGNFILVWRGLLPHINGHPSGDVNLALDDLVESGSVRIFSRAGYAFALGTPPPVIGEYAPREVFYGADNSELEELKGNMFYGSYRSSPFSNSHRFEHIMSR